MNNKTKIACTFALLIASAFFATSMVCFVKTYNKYEKQHDELLAKNLLGGRFSLKCEREEQEEFAAKIVKYYREKD